MIIHGATLDVARQLALFVSSLPQAERRRLRTRRGVRALTTYRQTVLTLTAVKTFSKIVKITYDVDR